MVLSVDEKPSIQALEPRRGYVQTSSGKVVQGLKSTYQRHGTVNLFAALEVATGVIRGKTTQTKKRADFQAFIEEVVADEPGDREIHVILDSLNIHQKNDEWLVAHQDHAGIGFAAQRVCEHHASSAGASDHVIRFQCLAGHGCIPHEGNQPARRLGQRAGWFQFAACCRRAAATSPMRRPMASPTSVELR